MNIIAHAGFVGIDHRGAPFSRSRVLSARRLVRGRVVAAAARARLHPHARSGARARRRHAGRLSDLGGAARRAPKTPMRVRKGKLILKLPARFARLQSDRLFHRLRQLARLIGREPEIQA